MYFCNMKLPSSTYSQTLSTATYCGTFCRYSSSGIDPRKGWRTPLDKNRYSEQRDAETGLSYFDARYYEPEMQNIWLSVDPMANKYPNMSPYNYCAWNPIKLVDEEGKFPRFPFGIRAVFSRQVRQAVSYKMKHGGDLSVWESRGGCVFASVSTSTYTKNSVTISEKMFRPKGYTKGGQINPTTDFLVRVESWMEEPSTSIVDLGLKSVANIGYSVINDPMIVFSGSSLAGTEATPNESMVAFAGTASSVLGSLLSKGMGLIKTVGESGLDKYNDFVSQMGNYQGKSKSQMGRLYQNNKNLNDAIITYKKAESGINVLSALKTED